MATWVPTIDRLEPARDATPLTDVMPLLEQMVDSYGQGTVAGLLGVDRSTVSLWVRGKRRIGNDLSARILDVHAVLSRAHRVYNPALAARWLMGHDPRLGGARPIDVVATGGASAVIDALDEIEAGAYA
jgi:uncharacterized protein (DUF2384 family)